jgi:uncharacterized membrane protein YagU involved in acid resistance
MATRREPSHRPLETPLTVALRGAAAGLAATLVLSILSRVLPGLWNERPDRAPHGKPPLPADPFDPQAVHRWQERSRAPAAFQPQEAAAGERSGAFPAVSPAGALTQPQGPGPEGLAEQFAFKVASGIFDRDVSAAIRPVGMTTHLTYGSLWGVLYGILQASYRLPPRLFGALYGAAVYGVGPAFLVPAMKLMRPPQEEPALRTSMLLLGHLVYGVALAEAFEAFTRRET